MAEPPPLDAPDDDRRGVSDDARRAVRGSVALAAGQATSRGLQLLFVLVATRAVAPDQFGRYSIAAALLVFGAFIGDFGTTRLIIRAVSRDVSSADRILSGTLLPSATLGLLAWAAVSVAARIGYDPASSIDVAIAGASLPLTAASTSVAGALDGVGRFAARTASNVLQAVLAAGGGALAIWVTQDVRWALACLPAGALVGLASAVWAVRRRGLLWSPLRFDLPEFRMLLRGSVPFALFSGLGALSARFDVTLLSLVKGPADAAAYDVALRSTEALWYLQTLVTGPTMFLLSRRLGAADRRGAQRAFSEAIRLSYLSGLLLSALLVGLHGTLIRLLGGSDYGDAAPALAILGGSLFLTFVGLVQGTAILAGDHLGAGLRTAASITAATVAIDAVLVPAFGVPGAASAGAATALLTCVVFGRFGRRAEGLLTPWPPWGAVLGAVAAGGTAWALQDLPVVGVPAAVAIFGAAALGTGAVRQEDLRRLRRVLSPGSAG